jgi:DNA topoisomerase-1
MMTQLKKYGIGRPSCAGTILEKIISEGLIFRGNKAGEKALINLLDWSQGTKVLEETTQEIKTNAYRRRLFSTELGLAVDNFVTEYFPELFNYDFTRELEESMKQIEKGQAVWHQVVDMLYKSFAPKIKDFYQKHRPDNEDGDAKPKWERPEKRELGTYKGENVYTYLARYGPVIQIGDDDNQKRQYVNLPNQFRIEDVQLAEVEHLLGFPKTIGKIGRKQLVLHNGKNGLYLKLGADKKGYNLREEMFEDFDEKEEMMNQVDKLRLPLIEKSIKACQEGKKVLRKIKDIEILNGQYGPYFRFQNKNVSVPKYIAVDVLTYEKCMELYQFKLKGKKGQKISLKKGDGKKDTNSSMKPKISLKLNSK